MKESFGHNRMIENVNSVINDKLILRFLQDNVLTDNETIKFIDELIASDKKNIDKERLSHHTMFSMCLKIILFKYLYQETKAVFLKEWPDGFFTDIVKEL